MEDMAGTPTTRREFLRRTALAAGGVAAGATGLAACAGKTAPNQAGPALPVATTRPPAPPTPPHRTQTHPAALNEAIDTPETPSGLLRIANRPGSIGPDTVRDYQLATGVTVDYYEDITDDPTWLASVAPTLARRDDMGTDLDILGDAAVGQLIEAGRLSSLDDTNIPNRVHLRRELAAPGYDPHRRRSLPWTAGMAGLAYNPGLTGRPITVVGDLFDPAFKGRVTMLADLRDGLGMVMMGQGNSPAHATLATVTQAVDLVGQARLSGQVARFTGNADFADLVSGQMAVAQVRSGDVAGLQAANPALAFVVPQAGSTLFARDMVIPDTGHNQVAAESWMNWIYDRANYARLIQSVKATVVLGDMTAALAQVSPTLAADPLVNPPATTWARLAVWAGLDPRTEQRYTAIYRQVTG
jgi:spermidine/putrescine transport system substrate-binding protein